MAKVMTLATMTKATKGSSMSLEQAPVEKVLTETDEEILNRLRERFEILDDMTRAVKKGAVRAMIEQALQELANHLV